jgi:hypothetical protein
VVVFGRSLKGNVRAPARRRWPPHQLVGPTGGRNHCRQSAVPVVGHKILTMASLMEVLLNHLVGLINIGVRCHIHFDDMHQRRAVGFQLFRAVALGKQAARQHLEAVPVQFARQKVAEASVTTGDEDRMLLWRHSEFGNLKSGREGATHHVGRHACMLVLAATIK